MKNFFKYIKSWFDDSNTVNEKAIVGFIAFFMIIVAFSVDTIKDRTGLHVNVDPKLVFPDILYAQDAYIHDVA